MFIEGEDCSCTWTHGVCLKGRHRKYGCPKFRVDSVSFDVLKSVQQTRGVRSQRSVGFTLIITMEGEPDQHVKFT